MLRRLLSLLIVALSLPAAAQRLTLAECRRLARANYPLIRQYDLVSRTTDYSVANAAKAWLPSFTVGGGALAFTDVLNHSAQMKAMGVDTKNYAAGVSLMISQTLYDGGRVAAAKGVTNAEAEVTRKELDVKLYEVDERVEQLFFGVLLLDGQLAQNSLLQSDWAVSRSTVESMVSHGVARESDLDAVSVQQTLAAQQRDALEATRSAYLQMLALFVGIEHGKDISLEKPQTPSPGPSAPFAALRPEQGLYDAQNTLLGQRRKQLDARLRPTLSLMGGGAWHSRVSEFVHNAFLGAGISLSWNVGALYTRRNDLRKLELAQLQNESLRQTFLFNTRLQDRQAEGNVIALRKQIARDEEVVRLQESLCTATRKRVEGGTESVNELVRQINAADMARTRRAVHEIELLKALYHRCYIAGE